MLFTEENIVQVRTVVTFEGRKEASTGPQGGLEWVGVLQVHYVCLLKSFSKLHLLVLLKLLFGACIVHSALSASPASPFFFFFFFVTKKKIFFGER